MSTETLKHFKYEITLGAKFPMPKPPIDFYPNEQYSVQQYLRMLCKEKVGSLGKRDGKWEFGGEVPDGVRITSRPDIMQIFDFAVELKIIEPKPPEGTDPNQAGVFIPYQLSKPYWNRFDSFAG